MKQDFKLNLPQTSFPMKGRLFEREPLIQDLWKKKKIYSKIQNKNRNKPLFTFIDGPPYANGRIHLGTALNKILKDILIKQNHMSGRLCPFIPIWDCHGLPIELRALKKIKKGASHKEIRQACREEALHWVDVQEKQFSRIGVLADWENKILTMDPRYEAEEIRILSDLASKNLLYRAGRPIHWCMKLKTAIAVSEVEYKNHRSPSIDVKFEVVSKNSLPSPLYLVIWTTTPWTLPANQAICAHPDLNYGLYKNNREYFLIATDLQDSFEKRTGLKLELQKTFKGSELENISYKHPFINQESQVILGKHVTLDAGTGLVHTAPGHGMDDFVMGQKYSLKVVCPVDESGNFTSEIKEYEGQNVFKANTLIIEKLKSLKNLIHYEEIEHSYPYNPRSKSPLIFRVTDQWFLNFEDKKIPIRKMALKAIEEDIRFVPSWNKQRLSSMIQESPDWCLSRQRVWGVPIIVFYCQSCQTPLMRPSLMKKMADEMEKSKKGIEYFFSTPNQKLLPPDLQCSKCGHQEFDKGKDILDVWFDSGVCHFVFKKMKGDDFFPSDVYLEGSDQHRGWFQTSLNSSVAYNQKTPFKTLITHGFVYDLEKRKMSKSLGNIIDPEDIIKKYGAEILRMWVASSDYSQDISSGEEVLSRVRETYRRFRNTLRFLIGNLYDFNEESDRQPLSQMEELDQWILSLFSKLSKDIIGFYEKFEFHKVYQSLNKFFTTDLSAVYLDIIKDRLYTFKNNSKERRSAQTALYIMCENLLSLMAPITSFLSEEAYEHLPSSKKEESIFLTSFKKLEYENKDLEKKFQTLMDLRQMVSKEIETLRKNQEIRSNLEGSVHLTLPPSDYSICQSYPHLEKVFIVSSVHLSKGPKREVKIQKADGKKCARCWHYDVNLDPKELCPKCLRNL